MVEDHLSSLCWEEVSLACGQIPGDEVPVHRYWTHHRLPTTLFNLGVSFLRVWERSPGICDWLPCPTNQVQKHSSYPEQLGVCRDLFLRLGVVPSTMVGIWAENLPNWFTIPIILVRSDTHWGCSMLEIAEVFSGSTQSDAILVNYVAKTNQ